MFNGLFSAFDSPFQLLVFVLTLLEVKRRRNYSEDKLYLPHSL